MIKYEINDTLRFAFVLEKILVQNDQTIDL